MFKKVKLCKLCAVKVNIRLACSCFQSGDIDDQVGHQGDFWDINSEELVGLTSQLNV